ncbi:MAG: uroporphyrinogen decarboxylase [Coriobacteriia bacterium]|nr:uroporphyrinogen decarboxylase [Coriobacteriia bacterium]
MAFNDLFIRTARLQPTEATPVWMMRQAGRYMSEYREIRANHTFLEMCYDPDLAVEITLQPVDLIGVDAAILFSDILVLFPGMGLDLEFQTGIGPVINNPIRSLADAKALRFGDPDRDTPYVMESIRIARHELRDKVPLIGFSGAPFTLASYAIEGRGTREFINCKSFMWNEPEGWDVLMSKFTQSIIDYMCAQIDAGAQTIQLFDSWVGFLSPRDYEQRVLPYSKQVLDAVVSYGKGKADDGGDVPVIHFANGATSMIDLVQQAGGNIVGLDWRLDMKRAVNLIDSRFGIQGNIDPISLFASEEEIKAKVVDILEAVGKRPGHIFNLGHGIQKTTDPDKARHFIKTVQEESRRIRS